LAEQPAERAKAERIQTEKTIAAFSVLTERLDALAERTSVVVVAIGGLTKKSNSPRSGQDAA
jgi:hypothetical protein